MERAELRKALATAEREIVQTRTLGDERLAECEAARTAEAKRHAERAKLWLQKLEDFQEASAVGIDLRMFVVNEPVFRALQVTEPRTPAASPPRPHPWPRPLCHRLSPTPKSVLQQSLGPSARCHRRPRCARRWPRRMRIRSAPSCTSSSSTPTRRMC